MNRMSRPDEIAELCISTYLALPKSFHPQPRSNGTPQYCILAGFVLHNIHAQDITRLKCISVATGSKCLPASRLPTKGDVLHDCHAEVLARRGAVRWLYEEILRWTEYGTPAWIRNDSATERFYLQEGVSVCMYVSTLPCGDASMLSLALAQDQDIARLKSASPRQIPTDSAAARGRDGYELRGVLRTKPGRSDSEPTMSMSCSDKIASWSLFGFQGALLSTLFTPVYIDQLIIGEVEMELRELVDLECRRAFCTRLLKGDFATLGTSPKVHFTEVSFRFSLSQVLLVPSPAALPVPSGESVSWISNSRGDSVEALVRGIKRGANMKKSASQSFRSRICKAALFDLHRQVVGQLLGQEGPGTTYFDTKREATEYQLKKAASRGEDGPLAGWIVTGREYESFKPAA